MPRKQCPLCKVGSLEYLKKLQKHGQIYYLYRCRRTGKTIVGSTYDDVYIEVQSPTNIEDALFTLINKIELQAENRTQHGEGSDV